MIIEKISTLIIEDDPLTEAALKAMLLDNFPGSNVICVDTLNKAYPLVDTQKFDLIVLDLNLPNGKGIETVGKLITQMKEPKPPILSITGEGSVSDEVESILKGSQEFLHKPFNCTDYINAIHKTLARHSVRPLYKPLEENILSIKNTLENMKSN